MKENNSSLHKVVGRLYAKPSAQQSLAHRCSVNSSSSLQPQSSLATRFLLLFGLPLTRVLTFACYSGTHPVANLGQCMMLSPNLGALADNCELGRGVAAERPDTLFFSARRVCRVCHACAHCPGKQSLFPLGYLTGLTSGMWEAAVEDRG